MRKPDRGSDPNIASIHRFFVGLRYGEESWPAEITVREYAQQGNSLYSIETVELDKKAPGRK